MKKFTQKYVIVYLIKDLPLGYEYAMSSWPLHVTLLDVFAINGSSTDLIADLEKEFANSRPVTVRVIDKDLFGEDSDIPVALLNKTTELQHLHNKIIGVLKRYDVKFNNPEYVSDGFRPHSTIQKDKQLKIDDIVTVGSITLIDMFPNKDPRQRRILGTIHFK